jgi:hypothetical protein
MQVRGADPEKIREVANMATMIKELRRKNKENFPGPIELAISALKRELMVLLLTNLTNRSRY